MGYLERQTVEITTGLGDLGAASFKEFRGEILEIQYEPEAVAGSRYPNEFVITVSLGNAAGTTGKIILTVTIADATVFRVFPIRRQDVSEAGANLDGVYSHYVSYGNSILVGISSATSGKKGKIHIVYACGPERKGSRFTG